MAINIWLLIVEVEFRDRINDAWAWGLWLRKPANKCANINPFALEDVFASEEDALAWFHENVDEARK